MWGDSKARRMKKNSGGSTSGSVKKQLKKKGNQKEREVNSISSITDIDLSSAVQGSLTFFDFEFNKQSLKTPLISLPPSLFSNHAIAKP